MPETLEKKLPKIEFIKRHEPEKNEEQIRSIEGYEQEFKIIQLKILTKICQLDFQGDESKFLSWLNGGGSAQLRIEITDYIYKERDHKRDVRNIEEIQTAANYIYHLVRPRI